MMFPCMFAAFTIQVSLPQLPYTNPSELIISNHHYSMFCSTIFNFSHMKKLFLSLPGCLMSLKTKTFSFISCCLWQASILSHDWILYYCFYRKCFLYTLLIGLDWLWILTPKNSIEINVCASTSSILLFWLNFSCICTQLWIADHVEDLLLHFGVISTS